MNERLMDKAVVPTEREKVDLSLEMFKEPTTPKGRAFKENLDHNKDGKVNEKSKASKRLPPPKKMFLKRRVPRPATTLPNQLQDLEYEWMMRSAKQRKARRHTEMRAKRAVNQQSLRVMEYVKAFRQAYEANRAAIRRFFPKKEGKGNRGGISNHRTSISSQMSMSDGGASRRTIIMTSASINSLSSSVPARGSFDSIDGSAGIDFETFSNELLKMPCFPSALSTQAVAKDLWEELLRSKENKYMLTYQDCSDLAASAKKEKNKLQSLQQPQTKDEKSRKMLGSSLAMITGKSENDLVGTACRPHGYPAWETVRILTPGVWGELGSRRAPGVVHSYTSTMRNFDKKKEADNLLMADGTWVLDYSLGGRDSSKNKMDRSAANTKMQQSTLQRRVSGIISFDAI
jgi:hypothetical protein